MLAENTTPAIASIGVVTEFKSLLVLKGPKLQRFTLHHYRLAPTDGVVINGPDFKTYQPKEWGKSFLMFLIREHDGRYSPTAGQMDPILSIQEISHL